MRVVPNSNLLKITAFHMGEYYTQDRVSIELVVKKIIDLEESPFISAINSIETRTTISRLTEYGDATHVLSVIVSNLKHGPIIEVNLGSTYGSLEKANKAGRTLSKNLKSLAKDLNLETNNIRLIELEESNETV